MAKFQSRDGNTPKKLDPYEQLGFTDVDRTSGKEVAKLRQTVSKLSTGILSALEQKQFKEWLAGEKFANLTDLQKELAKKLEVKISSAAEALRVAAEKSSLPSASRAANGNSSKNSSEMKNDSQVQASVLGSPFHNPYTFIPFGKSPTRIYPTPLTIDEIETDRVSGVLELEILTISPLLSCSPTPDDLKADHKCYKALSIENDVIVPASGIRGALRSLMTILTGGTLGYIDSELFLTQGRDVNLGPASKKSPNRTPICVFLGEVVKSGSSTRSGTIRLGETRLIKAEDLEMFSKLQRPQPGKKIVHFWAHLQDDLADPHKLDASVLSVASVCDSNHKWKIKLSGEPINKKGKREGAFYGNGELIELEACFWGDYQGRNRHGDHAELRNGDLVWLEPEQYDLKKISKRDHIASLQWARWGRNGERLEECIQRFHKQVLPDSFNLDGKVDEVTNLFGQIPIDPKAAGPFAARIRPENLVFHDSKKNVVLTVLAPLSAPHPGCIAFYRDVDDAAKAGSNTKLRGYKVYRNTKERGLSAPWNFSQQGVYGDQGNLKDSKQKLNKTCELLNEGATGKLRIAFRALTSRELSLLVLACSVDWRLGGGKPLGLGHCRVTTAKWCKENGEWTELFKRDSTGYPVPNSKSVQDTVLEELFNRVALWHASQQPVDKLRYPRAIDENKNKLNRGGHVWFGRHASMRKGTDRNGEAKRGLQVMWLNGKLKKQANNKEQIAPQILPALKSDSPQNDLLYGYDLISQSRDRHVEHDKTTTYSNLEPFDSAKHANETHQSGGNQSQNRETRQQNREGRP